MNCYYLVQFDLFKLQNDYSATLYKLQVFSSAIIYCTKLLLLLYANCMFFLAHCICETLCQYTIAFAFLSALLSVICCIISFLAFKIDQMLSTDF